VQVVPAGCWFGAELDDDTEREREEKEEEEEEEIDRKRRRRKEGSQLLSSSSSFSLVCCSVHPGFLQEDFEFGEREEMERLFPEHRELIRRLTKEPR
jgi:hypothetical protein